MGCVGPSALLLFIFQETSGASAPLSFLVFLFAITSPSYRSKTRKSKITVLRAIPGTVLALILTQCSICHLTAYKSMHLTPWLHTTVC